MLTTKQEIKKMKEELDAENKVSARLTTGKEGKLTIRMYLTEKQKERLLIQTGKQPNTLFNIIVM